MITAPHVFEDDHLPRRLLHRESAVDEVLRAWEAATTPIGPDQNVLLYGPSGVGKTVLARYCLAELASEIIVDHAYVRCLGASTAGVLRQTLQDLGADVAQNTPTTDLATILFDRVDQPTIVVLDEADGLPSTDALDRLLDVDEVSVCVICHDLDEFLARVDLAVGREFAPLQLGLDRYGVDELADILDARAQAGLRKGVVDRRQLRTIADEVAGVARFGIQALREAARGAAEHGHDEIQDVDVANSFARARRRVRESNLASLPIHHHILYELVREAGPITPAALHDRYDELADDVYRGRDQTPISERDRRRKLRKLNRYDLITIDGTDTNRHREYAPVDETIIAPIDINAV